MFDVEYGERVADSTRTRESRATPVTLSRGQLEQLSVMALAGAAAAIKSSHDRRAAEYAAEIHRGSQSRISRLFRHLFALPIAAEIGAAKEIAQREMAHHSGCHCDWWAIDAQKLATKWRDIAQKLTEFDHFDLPDAEFATLRDWAARGPAETPPSASRSGC